MNVIWLKRTLTYGRNTNDSRVMESGNYQLWMFTVTEALLRGFYIEKEEQQNEDYT